MRDMRRVRLRNGAISWGLFVDTARIGRYLEVELEGRVEDAQKRLDDMCRKLLANTVIENYRIEMP